MTIVEHIHTLLDEDKDALVSSYLSLLAMIRTHQDSHLNAEEFLEEIKNSIKRHLEKLPEDSLPILEELSKNESHRLQSLLDDDHVGRLDV